MEDFHRRLASLGLKVAADHGFALAGGYAVNAHGFLTRPSSDVDLFTTLGTDITSASAAVIEVYRVNGFQVVVDHESRYYVRLMVSDPAFGATSKVELVADIRLQPPVQMDIGPVLHPDDVAAGKVEALFTRAESRDFIDVDALLRSRRYDTDQLLELAARRDAGFDRRVFADMLAGVTRFPNAEFARYGIAPATAEAIRERMATWRAALLAEEP